MPFNLTDYFFQTCQISAKATVICLIILMIRRIFGERISPVWRYALWFILIALLIIPWTPVSEISLLHLLPGSGMITNKNQWVNGVICFIKAPGLNEFYLSLPSQTTFTPDDGILALPTLIWISGSVFVGAFILAQSIHFLLFIRNHNQVTHEKTLRLLEACKVESGVKSVLVLIETDMVESPALFGCIRPRLLLPKGTIKKMDQESLRLVLLHELRHLKHQDILTGWIMTWLLVIHWFNPLIWLSMYLFRRDREFACDAMTLSHLPPSDRTRYGLMLLTSTAGPGLKKKLPGLIGIIEVKSQIKRRIEMIANFDKKSTPYTILMTTCFIVFGLAVLTGANITENKNEKNLATLSENFTRLLTQEHYDEAVMYFDDTMKSALPPEKLKATWHSVREQVGEFSSITGTRAETFGEHEIIFVSCKFSNGPLDIKLVFDKTSNISGLWFVPPKN